MNNSAHKHTSIPETRKTLEKITDRINNGKLDRANEMLTKFIKKQPDDERALLLKAFLLEKKGDYIKALEYCEKALTLTPNNEIYLLKKAHLLYLLEDYSNVKTCLFSFLNQKPDNTQALSLIAKVFLKLKERPAHLVTLLRLAGLTKLDAAQQQDLFSLCSSVQLYSFSQQVINGFLAILDYEDLHTLSISNNIGLYITVTYKLNSDNYTLELNTVIHDALLIKSLPLVRLCSPYLERFLSTLRETFLRIIAQEQTIRPEFIPLMQGLALQNYLNEYVFYIKNDEKELLKHIHSLLNLEMKQSEWTPKQSEGLLLLLALYDSLHNTHEANTLLSFSLDMWPNSLKHIAKESLFSIHEELQLAKEVTSLTEIHDDVSKAVQEQYENNPYPRWNKMFVSRLSSLAWLIGHNCPRAQGNLPKELSNPSTPILIAGSGTGHQPLAAAQRFPSATITAIDISRRSLAYSQIKARDLNITNVNFYQADILELPESLGQFFYIECCGVLHHMADPMAGWKKLLSMLAPGGVMKIAVYSELARKDISVERNKISELHIEPTPDNIRLYRQALFNQKPLSPVASMFMDFYSLSECRDLLFHQHEQCFTWEKIGQCCDDLNVEFLGLVDHSGLRLELERQFPDDPHTNSIEKLAKFEAENTYAFRSMYQFLIQKPI